MAAAGSAFFGRELAAAADGRAYYASTGNGAVPHHHHFVQSGGAGAHAPAGGVMLSHDAAGSLAAGGGIGMAPASSFAAGAYAGAAAHVVLPVAALQQQQQPPAVAAAGHSDAAASFKGAWTKEEDEVLREMVSAHGDRKWATIARYLPGRIGKQCRERWINHLHPSIKKDVWTEEEDMTLIEAHRTCGNRWSVIARYLPGRSENSIKNHWNATKRGLKAKRRLRRRNSDQQAPPPVPGQLSLLAEYIRSLGPGAATGAADSAAPPPPPVTSEAPASGNFTQMAGPSNPPPGRSTVGMYLNPAPAPAAPMPDMGLFSAYGGGLPEGRYSYYLPPYAHMNLHYGLPPPQPPQMIGGQVDFHAAYAVAGMNNYLHHPFGAEQMNLARNVAEMEYDDRESSTNQGGGYYGEAVAGPSGASGNYQEEMEVAQMASMEFARRDQDVVTLDLSMNERVSH